LALSSVPPPITNLPSGCTTSALTRSLLPLPRLTTFTPLTPKPVSTEPSLPLTRMRHASLPLPAEAPPAATILPSGWSATDAPKAKSLLLARVSPTSIVILPSPLKLVSRSPAVVNRAIAATKAVPSPTGTTAAPTATIRPSGWSTAATN
jgi:hypothetical protein